MTTKIKIPRIPVLQVADFFISKSRSCGRKITNKKLNKLVYYAQVWYLVFLDRPIFTNPVQAWIHGPVIKEVYNEFKHNGFSNIQDI